MTARVLLVVVLATLVAGAPACGRADAPSTPAIRLTSPPNGARAYVEVTGLSRAVLGALSRTDMTAEQWSALLRVAVDADAPAVLGTHAVADSALRFTPAFPFDAGQTYEVRYDPSALPSTLASTLPGVTEAGAAPLSASIGLPASTELPSTIVTRVHPSSGVVPENLLRMYIEFSAPMSRPSGIEHLQLLDERGAVVDRPFLPLDYEFWNRDRTRFTVFFDPGRVKDGILPNQQMGRPLKAGHTYTLVISGDWQDGRGLPLKAAFRQTLRVGPADTQPLAPSSWTLTAPRPGSRDPLQVVFPEALDHGLLLRTIGVQQAGQALDGEAATAEHDTRWLFTPQRPWAAGRYDLIALSTLEDPAGNQIGRAFEIDNFETVDKGPDAQTVTLPFTVR